MIKGVIFLDVDGTLTESRHTSDLDPTVIPYLRALKSYGYKVVLISGNSLPVLRGLSIYMGIGGEVIAENGCVMYTDKIVQVCGECKESEDAKEYLIRNSGGIFKDTWQNMFRLCDRAVKWHGINGRKALELAKEILLKGGFDLNRLHVSSSGYAIHIHPRGCGKDAGIKRYLKYYGISRDLTYCVGDSATDLPMRSECNVLVAVGNADDELKAVADIVTRRGSSKGFIEFAKYLIRSQKMKVSKA